MNLEEFRRRGYNYGSVEQIQEYIDDLDENPPPPESDYKQMKNIARVLNEIIPQNERIKLNLSKNNLNNAIRQKLINDSIRSFNLICMRTEPILKTYIDVILNNTQGNILLYITFRSVNIS